MKKILRNTITSLSFLALIISCDNVEDVNYTPKVYDTAAGTLTVTAASPTVDPVTMTPDVNRVFEANFNSTKNGIVYYAMDLASKPTPTGAQLVNGSAGLEVKGKKSLTANQGQKVTFKEDFIYGGYEYAIFSVMASPDGYLSTVKKTVFTTPDTKDPVFVSGSPAHQTGGANPFGNVTFTFSEPVFYQDGSTISFEGFNTGRTVTINSKDALVSDNGLSITVKKHGTFPPDAFIIVTWADGTFKDNAGKSVAALPRFSHYFKTREFTLKETAFLLQGNYNYTIDFWGGALQNIYNTNAASLDPATGSTEIKLDATDSEGITLLSLNVFDNINGAAPNLKVKLDTDRAGRLAETKVPAVFATSTGRTTYWGPYKIFGLIAAPGSYDFNAGTITQWNTLYFSDTNAAIDDIDYNYTRIGTYEKSDSQRMNDLIKKSREDKAKLLKGKQRILPTNIELIVK